MRYSEILNEMEDVIHINSIKRLNTMLSYNEVNPPNKGTVIIEIDQGYAIKFPPNFIINGSMTIYKGTVSMFGDLTITGDLDFAGPGVEVMILPEKLKIYGNLILVDQPYVIIPKTIQVNGTIYQGSAN